MFLPILASGILYAAFAILVLITCIRSIVKQKKQLDYGLLNSALFLAEIVFTTIAPAIGFLRYDMYGSDIPFAKQHVWIIILLVVSSSAAFWLSRFTERSGNLFLRILLSAGMLQGILLCLVVMVHFAGYLLLGLILPWAGFELLSPVFAFFLLLRQLYFYNSSGLDPEALLPYREQLGMLPLQVQIFRMPLPARLFIYAGIAAAFVVLQAAAGYALGLQPDSLFRAFTGSSGFTFSRY